MKPEHIQTDKYYRPFLIGRGRAFEIVQWSAWRKARPKVKGYGMTEDEAVVDLTENVQPDHNSTLDALPYQPATARR